MHLAFFLAVSALLPLPREFHPLPGERECSSVEIGRAVAAFTIDAALPVEGYCLTVDASGITVRAADAAGAFYAGQTLRQLSTCGRVRCCRDGRGPGTNDTDKRYSRGGFVMFDPTVRRLRVRLQGG